MKHNPTWMPVQAPPAPAESSIGPERFSSESPIRPEPRRPKQSWLRRRLGPFLAAIAAFLAKFKSIILLIILIGGLETYKRWQLRRSGSQEQRAYYRVSRLDRALLAAVYLSLIALLLVGMHATNLPRTFG